jgi:beta-glucosidase
LTVVLQAVCASGTPTVVILIAGHSIELSHAKSACDSILFALLPSEFGGDAIVDTLLGKYSPAGRLPVTFYDHSIMKTRDPVDMKLRTGSGITYQHYRGTPLWEFGFGLSYSTFSFSWAKMDAASVAAAVVATGETLLVYTVNGSTVAAANNDRHSGDAQQDLVSPPIRELFNFTRIWLDVNQSKTIELGMSPEILANTDANGVQAVRAGTYTVAIGGVGRAARVEDGAVVMPLTVHGEDAELFSMTKLRERHAKRTELA